MLVNDRFALHWPGVIAEQFSAIAFTLAYALTARDFALVFRRDYGYAANGLASGDWL